MWDTLTTAEYQRDGSSIMLYRVMGESEDNFVRRIMGNVPLGTIVKFYDAKGQPATIASPIHLTN